MPADSYRWSYSRRYGDRRHPHAFGLFYHNTFESLFDLGCERSGYWPRYSYFCADGGDIDMFFINGPSVPAVVSRYTDLTGKSAMAPMEQTDLFAPRWSAHGGEPRTTRRR